MPKVVDADEQRTRVIDAAWNVILEDGLDGATMRRIAARAGCTTGLVTHYFSSKEDLLFKMVRHIARLARERIAHALEGRKGMAAVRALLIESTPLAQAHAEEWRIWVALWDHALTNARVRAEWNRRSEGWQGLVRERLYEAVDLGEISSHAPIDQLVDALAAFHYGLSLSSVLSPTRSSAARVVAILDQQLDFIVGQYAPGVLGTEKPNVRRRRSA